MTRPRLLVLAAACPRCGWRPSKRVTPQHVAALRTLDPAEPVDSVKCQHTGCKTIYTITAAAYHEARPV